MSDDRVIARGEHPHWFTRHIRLYVLKGREIPVAAVKVARVLEPVTLKVRIGDPVVLERGWSGYIVLNPSGDPFPSKADVFEKKARPLTEEESGPDSEWQLHLDMEQHVFIEQLILEEKQRGRAS